MSEGAEQPRKRDPCASHRFVELSFFVCIARTSLSPSMPERRRNSGTVASWCSGMAACAKWTSRATVVLRTLAGAPNVLHRTPAKVARVLQGFGSCFAHMYASCRAFRHLIFLSWCFGRPGSWLWRCVVCFGLPVRLKHLRVVALIHHGALARGQKKLKSRSSCPHFFLFGELCATRSTAPRCTHVMCSALCLLRTRYEMGSACA